MDTQQQQTTTSSHAAIDPATYVGALSLTVSDLERSLAFYAQTFGFALLQRDGSRATLGVAGTPVLLLTERPGAKPWPRERRSYTGLYHFAILVPTRVDLGRWLRHWLEVGQPLPGQGDHIVSEALYISDPDENGIEIYADRPRSTWRWSDGHVQMGTGPVDIRGLLAEAAQQNEPWTGLPAGTHLGHMHLQVGNIAEATRFYHDILGFDVVAAMPTALFVSAGGYHHHIGMNTWHSLGADPAPTDSVGLRFFTVELPSEEARAAVLGRLRDAGIEYTDAGDVVAVRDPWQNTILLHLAPVPDTQTASGLATAWPA
jgi:catechol 2,3-dioxygenase